MSATGPQAHDPSASNDSGSPRRVRFRGLPTILGVLFAPLALYLVVLAAGGGHGTYYAAKLPFPWTMMSTAVTKSITQPSVVLGIAQYPLYGIILDVARSKGRLTPAVLTLVAVHLCAIMLAFVISNPSFTP
ncbi:hypothetical protein [Bradyrhizobium sp.]|uniref:hypothetical protein n=1 Tax=Bradyrhizobium sp. TaxID=376 RepID=UPI001DBD0E27|nr:hypothetical protein [Bradyrhizobium sp.]MBI5323406.1 hypothetical protein [Bradyrhizobium sp.]